MTATAGELFLLMGNYGEAARLYKAAVAMARSEKASEESTWREASRLMAKTNASADQRALIRWAFAHLPDYSAVPE